MFVHLNVAVSCIVHTLCVGEGRARLATWVGPPSHAVLRRPAMVLERLRELASRVSRAWLDAAARAAVAEAAQSGRQLPTPEPHYPWSGSAGGE